MISVKREGIIVNKTDQLFERNGVLNPAIIMDNNRIHLFYRAVGNRNHSSIGYCLMDSPLVVSYRKKHPILQPEFDYESHGLEDPRITKLDELFYLTYTAYDGITALGALAVSSDLLKFEKRGIIVPQINYEKFRLITSLNKLDTIRY